VPAEPPEFGVWTFSSYDSAGKTSLQLGVRFENLNNGLTMTIYCPFWMLNKTGLNLSYRVSRNVIALLALNFSALEVPVMFVFIKRHELNNCSVLRQINRFSFYICFCSLSSTTIFN
jgi:vacuolar protein sorting-associated protein 13A/C